MLLESCAADLGLPTQYLRELAEQGNFLYKSFSIPKRNGGLRTIHHPTPELKVIQRYVARHVDRTCPVHNAAYAYRAGRGIGDHARAHAGAQYMLRMDMEDFFPSITMPDVIAVLEERADLDSADAEWAALIACREHCLTIGAPSSPTLSNAVCFQMDESLDGEARRVGARYTRYADDLYFSTSSPRVLGRLERNAHIVIRSQRIPSHLRVNRKKTVHSSTRGRMSVTGLILTPSGSVSIGRGKKRIVRSKVHRLDSLSPEARRRLSGYLAFVRDVEPQYIDRLYVSFGHGVMDRAMSGRD